MLPELDFLETPIGMIYVATRRVGDNVWPRMVEGILPNLQQAAPSDRERPAVPVQWPMMTRWLVPIDDTIRCSSSCGISAKATRPRPVGRSRADDAGPAAAGDSRKASGIPATMRPRYRSARSRSTAWNISSETDRGSACSAGR